MNLGPADHSDPGHTQVMLSTRLITELGDPRRACELSVVLPVHPTTDSALSPVVA